MIVDELTRETARQIALLLCEADCAVWVPRSSLQKRLNQRDADAMMRLRLGTCHDIQGTGSRLFGWTAAYGRWQDGRAMPKSW
jgi:hypothetical protein